ncbi:non-structural maintenance of chromosomes element 1 homolog [Artemia franciscana]|uniref:non-structural maintenance of chromosomes element 1 homolog n=1 Tax=Artemia franciscana TaxID=6661 RepID=UPI0032DB4046
MDSLNKKRHFFSRFLLFQGSVLESELQRFVPPNVSADDFLEETRKKLKLVGLDCIKRLCEDTGCLHYVLVNTSSGKHLKSNSLYSAAEYELFKNILTEIVTGENTGVASSIKVLNSTSSMIKKMNKADADKAILKFVSDGWIAKNSKGEITLTPRGVGEFKSVLESQLREYIADCHLCKDIVVKGGLCNSCGVKFHWPCFQKFSRNDAHNCPSCRLGIDSSRDSQNSSVKHLKSNASQNTQESHKNASQISFLSQSNHESSENDSQISNVSRSRHISRSNVSHNSSASKSRQESRKNVSQVSSLNQKKTPRKRIQEVESDSSD